MNKFLLTIMILSICVTVYAFPVMKSLNYTIPSPPKKDDSKFLYDYLNILYQRFNILQVTNKEPNGNINSDIGQIILYNNSGTYYLAVQTISPNGSVWKGIALGAI